jgi:hypothetical protein
MCYIFYAKKENHYLKFYTMMYFEGVYLHKIYTTVFLFYNF